MAKNVFLQMKEKSTSDKETLVETKFCSSMMVLGETCFENKNCTQLIAESCYEMGVAQGHLKLWTEAEKNFDFAITVLESRMESLKKLTASDEIKQEVTGLDIFKKSNLVTISDLRRIDIVLKKVRERESKVRFCRIGVRKDLRFVRIGDASYKEFG